MSDAGTFGRYLFLLALLLIAVAYFSGFVADTNSVSNAVTSLINTATGRDANGQFASYPAGTKAA